jgi:NADH:ubiquinone oxidoreductase subunit 3 (subunit A)
MLNIDECTCFAYGYDYMGLFFFFLISTTLAFVLLILSFILSPKQVLDAEKLSAYECGFEPFDEAKKTFDVHFYIVAILFIIFDLEVAFLFP